VTLDYQVSDGTVSDLHFVGFLDLCVHSNVIWPNDPPSNIDHFAAVGSEVLVNSTSANDQIYPQIAS